MEATSIIYPAIAMFILTMVVLLTLGFSRFIAVRTRRMSVKYYTTYLEGEQTPYLHLLGRHVQNHFEVPPLFYLGVLFCYVTGQVTELAVNAAWAFVGFRIIHAFIHLGPNNVSVRFFCFGLSLMALMVLWGSLLFGLMAQ